MDAYEATRIVFSRIQALDPENAAKVMGLLLIQDHGEKEMIRLAFGPESLLHSVVLNAKSELGLLPPAQLSRQSSFSSPRPGPAASPSPWAPQSSDGDLLEELQLQDQLSFLNDGHHHHHLPHHTGFGPKPAVSDPFFPDDCRSPDSPYGVGWGPLHHHRRSCSLADLCLGSDAGLGWRPCLYYARGFCKNGASCRFVHDDPAALVEQEMLLRSKSQRLLAAGGFPYSPTGSMPLSPSSSSNKCINFLIQQQNESQRAAAAAALMLGGDEVHKFIGRSRMERADFANMVNPGSRQIYLTFPADSTFREEDVSAYFSIYGPVEDVRIPYQQKRMFGFVTFKYPETVKLILAKGNPHFVCDARVLVKPYKEKGKVPDKKQQGERGDFSGCTTPTGMDSRDPYDLQQLGARMLYGSSPDAMLRRKLEEQQQAAELQQAIELQGRRFLGLQLLDLKSRSQFSPPAINTGTRSSSGSCEGSPPGEKSLGLSPSPGSDKQQQQGSNGASHGFARQAPSVVNADGEEATAVVEASPNEDVHFHERAELDNLPDSPFASPTKTPFSAAAVAAAVDSFSVASDAAAAADTGNGHVIAASAMDNLAAYKSCFFQMPRFASGAHGAVGL